mmetsp:Transcript_3366/g.6643  ORF Transcript_3366/g.6643 Transcript_3366/m.6643 type:complete len:451 (+) Transcript_3366:106-1458(+)
MTFESMNLRSGRPRSSVRMSLCILSNDVDPDVPLSPPTSKNEGAGRDSSELRTVGLDMSMSRMFIVFSFESAFCDLFGRGNGTKTDFGFGSAGRGVFNISCSCLWATDLCHVDLGTIQGFVPFFSSIVETSLDDATSLTAFSRSTGSQTRFALDSVARTQLPMYFSIADCRLSAGSFHTRNISFDDVGWVVADAGAAAACASGDWKSPNSFPHSSSPPSPSPPCLSKSPQFSSAGAGFSLEPSAVGSTSLSVFASLSLALVSKVSHPSVFDSAALAIFSGFLESSASGKLPHSSCSTGVAFGSPVEDTGMSSFPNEPHSSSFIPPEGSFPPLSSFASSTPCFSSPSPPVSSPMSPHSSTVSVARGLLLSFSPSLPASTRSWASPGSCLSPSASSFSIESRFSPDVGAASLASTLSIFGSSSSKPSSPLSSASSILGGWTFGPDSPFFALP